MHAAFLALVTVFGADFANVTHMELSSSADGLTNLVVHVRNTGMAAFYNDLSLLFECTPGQGTPIEFSQIDSLDNNPLAKLAPGATSVLMVTENLCHCGRGAVVRLSNVTISNAEPSGTKGGLLIPLVPYSSCLDGSRGSEPPFVWDVDRSGEINTSDVPGIVRGDHGLPVTQYSTGRNGFAVNIYGGKGMMPHFKGSEVINGGLPQLGSLKDHLDRYKISLNALIRDPDYEVR